jgi:acyl-coenzyme A thioesterase PaaI-like protein
LRAVHCNSRGFVHGGVIAALADNAMGLSFVRVFKATVEDPANPAKGAVIDAAVSSLTARAPGAHHCCN